MNILITVLVYSTILTIIAFYKESNSYYTIDNIDVVVAGPVMWGILLLLVIFCKPIKAFLAWRERHQRKYRTKSQKQIAKTVAKIMANARKRYAKRKTEYFDLELYASFGMHDESGWNDLILRKPFYDKLNKRFGQMMRYQKEDTLAELRKYFIPITKEIAEADGYDCYYCRDVEKKNLMKINFNA